MVSCLSLLLSSKDFTRVVQSQCCYELLWLRYLRFSLMQIRGLTLRLFEGSFSWGRKGGGQFDHEIKIVHFTDELISELSQKASRSKLNFSKSQTSWSVVYQNIINKWDKIYDNLTKKIHI